MNYLFIRILLADQFIIIATFFPFCLVSTKQNDDSKGTCIFVLKWPSCKKGAALCKIASVKNVMKYR